MPKLMVEDLKKIKDKHRKSFVMREGTHRAKVVVHMGECGVKAGARDMIGALMEAMSSAGAEDVVITTTGCAGSCGNEPMATVEVKDEAPVRYGKLDAGKIRKIFMEHVQGGSVVEEYVLPEEEEAPEPEQEGKAPDTEKSQS